MNRVRITPLTIIATAILLLLMFTHLNADLLSRGTLSTLTPLVAIMAIVAIGQAFVIGTGGIDLSVPATISLVGAIMVEAPGGSDAGLPGALLFAGVACIAIGFLNGLLVEALALNALVVTLAVGQVVGGVNRLYSGDLVAVADVPPRLTEWANASVGGLSYLLAIAAAAVLVGALFLHRMVYGRRLVASSASRRTAVLAGLRARRYRVLAYVVASLTYGFAAVLLAGWVQTPTLALGDPYLLGPIVAVVLGGAVLTGGRVNPVATFLGAAFVVALGFNLRVLGLPAGVRLIAEGAVLALGLSLAFLVQNRHRIRRALRRGGRRADSALVEGTVN